MKTFILSSSLVLGASATAASDSGAQCCTAIAVSGSGLTGTLGQLSDGQNRIGPQVAPGTQYCLKQGGFTDSSGRGCISTAPTGQFQCDQGAAPTPGFSISGGQISFNGNATFYACPADDKGDYNIYTQPMPSMPKCVPITLTAQNKDCTGAPSQSPTPYSSTKPKQTPSSYASPSSSKQAATTVPVVKTSVITKYDTKSVPVYKTTVQTVSTPVYLTSIRTEKSVSPETIVQTSLVPVYHTSVLTDYKTTATPIFYTSVKTETQLQTVATPVTKTEEETIVKTVPGPTSTVEETQYKTIPGPTSTVEDTQIKTVPGPTSTVKQTQYETVPGPTSTIKQTQYTTIPGPTSTVKQTQYETIPGPTSTVKQTQYQTVPGPTVTKEETTTAIRTVPGPTKEVTSQCPARSTVTMTSVGPAPPAPPASTMTITSIGPAPSPSTVTITKSAPGTTITVTSQAPPVTSYITKATPTPTPSATPTPSPSASPSKSKESSTPSPYPSKSEAPSASPKSQAPQAPSGSGCPMDLQGKEYQYPHLIVPVDSSKPNTALGNSYNGQVSSTMSTVFNFDIPQSYQGKTCDVVFTLPRQDQLPTSSFTTSGSGGINASLLKGPADAQTSYSNAPAIASQLGSHNLGPGQSVTLFSGPCAAGQRIAYELGSTGGFAVNYFQDYNPCPIGLYVIAQ